MDDEVGCCYHLTKEVNLGGLAGLLGYSRKMAKLDAAVGQQSFSFSFQVRAPNHCSAKHVGTSVGRLLVTTVGGDVALPDNWMGSVGETDASRRQFVADIIVRSILKPMP